MTKHLSFSERSATAGSVSAVAALAINSVIVKLPDWFNGAPFFCARNLSHRRAHHFSLYFLRCVRGALAAISRLHSWILAEGRRRACKHFLAAVQKKQATRCPLDTFAAFSPDDGVLVRKWIVFSAANIRINSPADLRWLQALSSVLILARRLTHFFKHSIISVLRKILVNAVSVFSLYCSMASFHVRTVSFVNIYALAHFVMVNTIVLYWQICKSALNSEWSECYMFENIDIYFTTWILFIGWAKFVLDLTLTTASILILCIFIFNRLEEFKCIQKNISSCFAK